MPIDVPIVPRFTKFQTLTISVFPILIQREYFHISDRHGLSADNNGIPDTRVDNIIYRPKKKHQNNY